MKSINASFSVPFLFTGLLAGEDIPAATAYAGPDAGGNPNCPAPRGEHVQFRMHERRAQCLASLKEKLKLARAQEAAWDAAFAASLQFRMPQAGTDHMAMRESARMETSHRLDMMQAMSDKRHAQMTERMASIEAFHAPLAPEQHKRFDAEALPARQPRWHRLHHPA